MAFTKHIGYRPRVTHSMDRFNILFIGCFYIEFYLIHEVRDTSLCCVSWNIPIHNKVPSQSTYLGIAWFDGDDLLLQHEPDLSVSHVEWFYNDVFIQRRYSQISEWSCIYPKFETVLYPFISRCLHRLVKQEEEFWVAQSDCWTWHIVWFDVINEFRWPFLKAVFIIIEQGEMWM